MSDVKEESRQSRSGMRFEESSSNLAPVLSPALDLTAIPANSTEIIEHPRVRAERETHDRARHYLRHWAFLVSGIVIGAALIVFVRLSSKLEETPSAASTSIKVAAVDSNQLQVAPNSNAASQSVGAVQPAAQQESQLQPSQDSSVQTSAEPEPSNIIEHARTRSVSIEPRKFLFSNGDLRSYDSDFVPGRIGSPGEVKASAPQSISLKPLDDNSGRYHLNGTNVEWQGSWQPEDPAYNVRLGSAYLDYLNKTFGNSVGGNLSAINREPTNFLSKVSRPVQNPSAARHYGAVPK